jgi:hypothetical protein
MMLVLAGCSTKFTYRFLDWVVAWSVDDYVNWNKPQQRQFDSIIDQQLLWHRRSQLPRYSQWLRQLQLQLEQPLTVAIIEQQLEQVSLMAGDVMLHIAPDASLLLASLSDAQVTELLANIDAKIADSEAEYTEASEEQLDKDRVKKTAKAVKRLMGRLNDDQQQMIVDWNQRLQTTWPEWIASRKHWRSQFAKALSMRQLPGFEQQIVQLFTESQTDWTPAYEAIIDANTAAGIDLIIALQASLSDKQRKHVNKQLNGWVKAFDELAADASL